MIQIDMEMPQNCKFCPLHDVNPDQCPIRTIYKDDYATSRFTDCPLYKIAEDTDTISRQAVIDALQDRYKLYSWDDGGAQKAEIGRIIREIYDMPSAQPEIIRCKDCKHHHYEGEDIPYCDRIDYGYGWKDNDYCSMAERRADE